LKQIKLETRTHIAQDIQVNTPGKTLARKPVLLLLILGSLPGIMALIILQCSDILSHLDAISLISPFLSPAHSRLDELFSPAQRELLPLSQCVLSLSLVLLLYSLNDQIPSPEISMVKIGTFLLKIDDCDLISP
jgi:hypothetical protein